MSEIDPQLASSLARCFRLVRPLGAGGMGAVYLAEQIAVGHRPVALKVLSRKLLDDPDFLLRFQNEAASTGRIHHPNVVTIYESGQADDGTPYIAMEFLEGESLREALARLGALPVPEVAEILQQTARGLNAAHKLGIIHRDLKPDNIFLTYPDDEAIAPATGEVGARHGMPVRLVDGTVAVASASPPANVVVKIVDFGIAKLREFGAHTQTGTVLGTPAYMSYEQACGMRSDELDARSDVYSLGVVVYEMLTGRTPFQSDTPIGYLRMHMQEAPRPFCAVKPDLPALPQLESVVMKALTKGRSQRYGSASEFAREFAQAASAPAPSKGFSTTKMVEFHSRGQSERQQAEAKRLAKEEPKVAAHRPSRRKYVVLALVGLAVFVAAIWYFSPQEMLRRHGAERNEASKNGGFTAGDVRENAQDGLKYVWIPPGMFMMGCSPGDNECENEEKPSHQVTISKRFWMGQTEVTVGAYKRFANASGRSMPREDLLDTWRTNPGWGDESMLIVDVSWYDAQAYCGWAGGRLPTEAEWEYAARGGGTASRHDDLDAVAWYMDNSGRQRLDGDAIQNQIEGIQGTVSQRVKKMQDIYMQPLKQNGNSMHEVGQKRATGFGLFDMLGNVWEWVSDWYDEKYYQNSPSQDPAGPRTGHERVLRGGSWEDPSKNVRVSLRWRGIPRVGVNFFGFRCASDVISP